MGTPLVHLLSKFETFLHTPSQKMSLFLPAVHTLIECPPHPTTNFSTPSPPPAPPKPSPISSAPTSTSSTPPHSALGPRSRPRRRCHPSRLHHLLAQKAPLPLPPHRPLRVAPHHHLGLRTPPNAPQAAKPAARLRHEQCEAAAMRPTITVPPEPTFDHLAPHLDAALARLSAQDRDAVIPSGSSRKNPSPKSPSPSTPPKKPPKNASPAPSKNSASSSSAKASPSPSPPSPPTSPPPPPTPPPSLSLPTSPSFPPPILLPASPSPKEPLT